MNQYSYPYDAALDSVLALVETNGIPCIHQKPTETEDAMKRKIRVYSDEDEYILIIPIPTGIDTTNNGAGNNFKRSLKILTNAEVAILDRVVFNSVTYEVGKVEEQGNCGKLYQVFLKEV